MVSSVIDDKPVACTWLDRLRFSRGVSTTEDEDASGTPLSLDDFLRRNHQTDITGDPIPSDSPPSDPIQSDPELPETPSDPNRDEWYGVMTDVLSELFNFSDGSSRSSAISNKKLPRKQSNPKHCSVDKPEDVSLLNPRRDFAAPSRDSYSKKPVTEKRGRKRSLPEADDVAEEEEEKGEKDLIGFSRSEVTVIDTSFNIWKSEKLVFRRRNVWKVRDKKGKSRPVSPKKNKTVKKIKKKKMKIKKNKKRKRDVDDDDDDDDIAEKRKKMKISRSAQDNNPQYEDVSDDPESSNANRILLNCLLNREKRALSVYAQATKNSEPDPLSYRSLA
ncbi:unnamed protein product [Cochlearia groenlandica]